MANNNETLLFSAQQGVSFLKMPRNYLFICSSEPIELFRMGGNAQNDIEW